MMIPMQTSLSYTDRLYVERENSAERGYHYVSGMPKRRVYAADQGWDELFGPASTAPAARQGATAGQPVTRTPPQQRETGLVLDTETERNETERP